MVILAAVNWYFSLFLLFAVLACVFSLLMLFTSNIVRMAFYLTLALGATAGLFMLAGAHFVGAMQLMIYVGGTLVLLIFGVMLTAQEGFVTMKTRSGDWVLAVVVGGTLLFLLAFAALYIPGADQAAAAQEAVTADDSQVTTPLGLALIGTRVDRMSEMDSTLRGGLSGYLLPFEIISVHLLVVLIGAAYLARARRHGDVTS